MAARWLDAAAQHVELLSSRLSELWSAGLDVLSTELGADPTQKAPLGPAWAVLLASLVALLAVAACGALLGGRRRPLRSRGAAAKEAREAPPEKEDGAEEQRRRSRRRTAAAAAKRAQMNGSTVLEALEHPSVSEEPAKQPPQVKTEKVIWLLQSMLIERILPEEGKKNKKKTKSELTTGQCGSSCEGKEPEEGTWETKVSNREKRQQRRKDKEPSAEPGSPVGGETPVGTQAELSAATPPSGLKKNRGEDFGDKAGKGDGAISQPSAPWNEVQSQNGRAFADTALKAPSLMGLSDGERWSPVVKTTTRRSPEPPTWGLPTEGTRGDVDEGLKTGLSSVSFSGLRLSAAGAGCLAPPSLLKQWDKEDYEWNDLYETAAVDPGSDWSTPSELWGNYEQPQAENPPPPRGPVAMATKESGEDKEKGDSTNAGNGKSKKKKKRRKMEDAGAVRQEPEEPIKVELAKAIQSRRPVPEKVHSPSPTAAEVMAEPPAVRPKKLSQKVATPSQAPQGLPEPQTAVASLALKPSGEELDPPKQVQKKKKARRET